MPALAARSTATDDLLTIPWHAVIVDEAHQLKNDRTQAGPWAPRVAELRSRRRPNATGQVCRSPALDATARPPASLPALASCTQMYKAAARLPTRLRYGLSGTPFQNDYSGGWDEWVG